MHLDISRIYFPLGNCVGPIVGHVPSNSSDDCLLSCRSAYPDCTWWTFDQADQICFHYKECSTISVDCEGCLTGRNDCQSNGKTWLCPLAICLLVSVSISKAADWFMFLHPLIGQPPYWSMFWVIHSSVDLCLYWPAYLLVCLSVSTPVYRSQLGDDAIRSNTSSYYWHISAMLLWFASVIWVRYYILSLTL